MSSAMNNCSEPGSNPMLPCAVESNNVQLISVATTINSPAVNGNYSRYVVLLLFVCIHFCSSRTYTGSYKRDSFAKRGDPNTKATVNMIGMSHSLVTSICCGLV